MKGDKSIVFDTETCGLHSVPVTIQYCEGLDGEIYTHHFWKVRVWENIQLLERIINHPHGIIAFNLAFDWFHICKFYTMMDYLHRELGMGDEVLEDLLQTKEGIAMLLEAEEQGSWGPCCKPHHAFDLFLHARKTQYQSTMERKDIVIKRVPAVLAQPLCNELEQRIPLKDIYFSRKKQVPDPANPGKLKFPKWQVFDIKVGDEIDPYFKNVRLIFAPTSALKALAIDALNVPREQILRYADVGPSMHPFELPFAPKANLIINQWSNALVQKQFENYWKKKARRPFISKDYHGTWPDWIKTHIKHWFTDEDAKKYAKDDVIYTRRLYSETFDSPDIDDDDSWLATLVAASRWRGHRVNVKGLQTLRKKVDDQRFILDEKGNRIKEIPIDPKKARAFILPHISEEDKVVLSNDPNLDIEKSTKKVVLETLSKRTKPCACVGTMMSDCTKCKGRGAIRTEVGNKTCECVTMPRSSCDMCAGKGMIPDPVAKPASQVLQARKVKKELELYDKLILARRLYANYKVIGALSSRMSGDGKFNVQGVKKSKPVRENFELADEDLGYVLCGGDFEAFEVTIADAVYNDVALRSDILACEKCDFTPMIINPQINSYICPKCESTKAKKIHAFFGMCVYPDMTYEQIKATDGSPIKDIYTECKRAVFALFYGGNEVTLMDRLGVNLEVALAGKRRFETRYPGVARAQIRVHNAFGSMRQPGGIGTRVVWKEPAEYASTLLGFKRYYILENQICRALFTLANQIPPSWRQLEGKVRRRDRIQTIGGAVSSSLYASAFAVQSSNIRTAINHEIQGTGSQITKGVQRTIWDYQPAGVGEWLVQPMNIHDELQCPVKKGHEEQVKKLVQDKVETYRPLIPLILLKWKVGYANWAAK